MIVLLLAACTTNRLANKLSDSHSEVIEDDSMLQDSAYQTQTGIDTSEAIDTGSTDTALTDTAASPRLDPCQQIILLEAYGAANRLWQYDIEGGQSHPVLTPDCSGMTALSASSKGKVFGLKHSTQKLYEIMPATGECIETALPQHPDYPELQVRGLAFVGFEETEKLYVSALESPTNLQAILFELDDQDFKLVSPLIGLTEEKAYVDLAGTSTSRLFGLHPSNGGSVIKEWVPSTGQQIANMPTMTPQPSGWSFVWHEGTFRMFISTQGSHTFVFDFDPQTGSLTALPDLSFRVVGAALASCAPDESGS